MKSRKLFTRQKAKNGEGRQAVIKHLLLPEEVIKELRLYKDAYSVCLARENDQWGNPIPVQVTWEQEYRQPAEQRQGAGEGEGRENGPP